MNGKKIAPTEDMVADVLAAKYRLGLMSVRDILRVVLNHPDAAELFEGEWKSRAERAEDALSDSVHVDEAARRVEAAREQGWDEAAEWSIHNINDIDAERIRKANPYRPAPALPTEDGAVIVPADGRESIAMTDAEGWAFDRMTYSAGYDRWYGMTTRGAIAMCSAEQVTPGTWRAV